MLILHPIETAVGLFWDDFKENKKEWLVLLLWTIPTTFLSMFIGWLSDKIRERYESHTNNAS